MKRTRNILVSVISSIFLASAVHATADEKPSADAGVKSPEAKDLRTTPVNSNEQFAAPNATQPQDSDHVWTAASTETKRSKRNRAPCAAR